MGTMVRHFPPTISMHSTKEVTMVPPFAKARKNLREIVTVTIYIRMDQLYLRRTNSEKYGLTEARMPKKAWAPKQTRRICFRPLLSARIPKIILPKNLLTYKHTE